MTFGRRDSETRGGWADRLAEMFAAVVAYLRPQAATDGDKKRDPGVGWVGEVSYNKTITVARSKRGVDRWRLSDAGGGAASLLACPY